MPVGHDLGGTKIEAVALGDAGARFSANALPPHARLRRHHRSRGRAGGVRQKKIGAERRGCGHSRLGQQDNRPDQECQLHLAEWQAACGRSPGRAEPTILLANDANCFVLSRRPMARARVLTWCSG